MMPLIRSHPPCVSPRSAAFAFVALVTAPAYAAGSNMPWEAAAAADPRIRSRGRSPRSSR